MGDGSEERSKQPKRVKQLETEFVKFVSCGAHCTAAIAEPRKNDGTVSTSRLWIWGQNQVINGVLISLNIVHFSLFSSSCNVLLSLQGSNLPRLFWGAFAPNTVCCDASYYDVSFLLEMSGVWF